MYSDRDEPLASVLTRTLMETNQEVPDFLQLYMPEGAARENLKFETESDFDPNDLGGAAEDFGGGGWGGEDGTADGAGAGTAGQAAPSEPNQGGWGSDAAQPGSNGASW